MEYKTVEENVEKIYEVKFNEKELKDLLDRIVVNASYKVHGKFCYHESYIDKLPNGDPMYINITNEHRCTSETQGSYPFDSIAFTGTKIVPPKLAYIIAGILKGDEDSIQSLLEYRNSDELIPIQNKINSANDKVNNISNYEFGRKIEALKKLEELCNDENENKFFDIPKLEYYYSVSLKTIELQLISEKCFKTGETVKLKNLYIKK